MIQLCFYGGEKSCFKHETKLDVPTVSEGQEKLHLSTVSLRLEKK